MLRHEFCFAAPMNFESFALAHGTPHPMRRVAVVSFALALLVPACGGAVAPDVLDGEGRTADDGSSDGSGSGREQSSEEDDPPGRDCPTARCPSTAAPYDSKKDCERAGYGGGCFPVKACDGTIWCPDVDPLTPCVDDAVCPTGHEPFASEEACENRPNGDANCYDFVSCTGVRRWCPSRPDATQDGGPWDGAVDAGHTFDAGLEPWPIDAGLQP